MHTYIKEYRKKHKHTFYAVPYSCKVLRYFNVVFNVFYSSLIVCSELFSNQIFTFQV